MVSLMLTCDALAFKIIEIHGYKFSASGLIFPINFMLAAVMTNSYGYNLAGRIIWIQLISQFIFIITVNRILSISQGKHCIILKPVNDQAMEIKITSIFKRLA
jgi:uncharacterized PurR-regulated membrane protein YhhQ (DUF165 family)